MWIHRACRSGQVGSSHFLRRTFSTSRTFRETANALRGHGDLSRVRNIGIIAHIDAGKTTTTERMLYYSGFTRRIGDVDAGSTVTDFLPAERARGITIQSAAVTFHWPPSDLSLTASVSNPNLDPHAINLIDTPGHADFTFEVIRSLRILDGAICILDGVAGVEAQTEKVWHQASNYSIPRLIFVNKLDREGAAFNRTIKEIGLKLHTWPLVCQIPWWKDGSLIGLGDAINFQALSWEAGGDGKNFVKISAPELQDKDHSFLEELRKARTALIEGLTDHDEVIVEEFLSSDEDWYGFSGTSILASIRRILLENHQKITPIFAGASFRNIGVQPLLDAVNLLLPSPRERPDPNVSIGSSTTSLHKFLEEKEEVIALTTVSTSIRHPLRRPKPHDLSKFTACALAFKVVNDARRGVLVYVRVYSGTIMRSDLLWNTNLSVTERAQRLLRMYASDAVEINSIDEGQIGVIAGLKNVRTGDTMVVYAGMNSKNGPPSPIDTLQLRPIVVPPPLWYTSIEPNSLSDEKHMLACTSLLLREDPSLVMSTDVDSGQTHISGMGELHLEIARDRLINEFKVKATVNKIAISYRETIVRSSEVVTETMSREIAGKMSKASSTAMVEPMDDTSSRKDEDEHLTKIDLPDSNLLTIQHPTLFRNGKPISSEYAALPGDLTMREISNAVQAGASAALARGPSHVLPVHSCHVVIVFSPDDQCDSSTTSAALMAVTRSAVTLALRDAASQKPAVLMEPVMNAMITVQEEAMGSVVNDLTSARGAHITSLDTGDEEVATHGGSASTEELTSEQLRRIYAPPDPFQGQSTGSRDGHPVGSQQRQIRARVPLREMVGYLNRLRSLTGGRGTFLMEIDRFEKMSAERMRAALTDMGTFV